MSPLQILIWLIRILLKRQAAKNLQRKSVVSVLKLAEGVRLSLTGIVALVLAIQGMSLGLILSITSLAFLAPLEDQIRLWILFGLGTFFFAVPLIGLFFALSSRLWLKALLQQEWVSKALRDNH